MPAPKFPSIQPVCRSIDWSTIVVICAIGSGLAGCRSKAHQDLYQQKMVSEIRVLEDQLYDADYQNSVLRDKVHRLESQVQTGSAKLLVPSKPKAADQPKRLREPEPEPEPLSDMSLDEGFDLGIEEGTPTGPENLSPAVPGATDQQPEGETGQEAPPGLLPPPSGPEPPGADDLELPDISPGEPMPPPSDREADDDAKPDGQIQLPDSLQAKAVATPSSLRIHQALSGGHRFDGDPPAEGMFLVINAVDDSGRLADLSQFDIDGELTVVALDPSLDASEAKIGRWEFSSKEIQKFVRHEPTSGIHLPIRWTGTKPSGDEVIIHVRLRAEEDEMRCQAKLKINAKAAIADWTPRG